MERQTFLETLEVPILHLAFPSRWTLTVSAARRSVGRSLNNSTVAMHGCLVCADRCPSSDIVSGMRFPAEFEQCFDGFNSTLRIKRTLSTLDQSCLVEANAIGVGFQV